MHFQSKMIPTTVMNPYPETLFIESESSENNPSKLGSDDKNNSVVSAES